jgi:Xaa-Pro aminopeptidase
MFSGLWTRGVFRSVLLVRADGHTVVATAVDPASSVFADEVVVYAAAPLGTLIDDQFAAATESLAPWLRDLHHLGIDRQIRVPPDAKLVLADFAPELTSLRRLKFPDEIEMIQRGIRGCEAGYAVARELVRPGLMEWDLYVQILSAATAAVGESIGELGNDFQSGTPGGPPRRRAMQDGELLPLDLSVVVRGYSSDLCRTFAVGSGPTNLQREAHRRVLAALSTVERSVAPGVSCSELYRDIASALTAGRNWAFPHHLGHGIGIEAHEAPRLNPQWNEFFQKGDVFTAEPGLYAEELRGGVRVERDYLVTETGVRALCEFPLDL